MADSEEPQKERTLTLPGTWPPRWVVPLQTKPIKRKNSIYTSVSFYMPTELCRRLGLNGSELIGIWGPGKRSGRDEVFLGVKLTQEEVAKLPKNGKRKRHNCDHESSPRGALYCITCGASLRGKPNETEADTSKA